MEAEDKEVTQQVVGQVIEGEESEEEEYQDDDDENVEEEEEVEISLDAAATTKGQDFVYISSNQESRWTSGEVCEGEADEEEEEQEEEGVEVEMEETDFRDDEEAGSQQPRDLPDAVQSTLSTEPKPVEGEQSSGQGSAVLASSPSGFGLGSFSAALLKRTKRTASIEQTAGEKKVVRHNMAMRSAFGSKINQTLQSVHKDTQGISHQLDYVRNLTQDLGIKVRGVSDDLEKLSAMVDATCESFLHLLQPSHQLEASF